ncbi:MAG: hypothetical protein ACK4F8_11550 [Aquabacterium sp.]
MEPGKILVRNIPGYIFNALVGLAAKRDRSTEAEARQAITAWVSPALIEDERGTRSKEVAQRLTLLLEQVNAAKPAGKHRPSHVAQAIGEERAQHVEDWFLGKQEPTFSQLASIAQVYGVRSPWLQHGDGHIYPVNYERLPDSPAQAVQWLSSWPNEDTDDDTLEHLHLIRENSEGGAFYLVKQSKAGRYLIYRTPYKISEEIGAGGEGALKHLFLSLEVLYKKYSSGDYRITSYLMRPDDVKTLINGNTNPAMLLRDRDECIWWEDIWDPEQYPTRQYWEGWKSLCERIDRAISSTPYLNELRAKNRTGEVQ